MAEQPAFSVRNLNMYFGNFFSSADKDVSASFNVWSGRTSFAVRRKGSTGKPMASITMPTATLEAYILLAEAIVKGGPDTALRSPLQTWNNEERKFVENGIFAVGVDKNMVPFFGLSTKEAGQHRFLIRMPRPNPLNEDLVTKEQAAVITMKTVIGELVTKLRHAEVLTNEKRDFSANGSNSRGASSTPARSVLDEENLF